MLRSSFGSRPLAAAACALALALPSCSEGDGVTEPGPQPAPAFTLSIDPPTLSLPPGQSATAQIQVDRTNFTGAVALSVSGLPAGVGAALSPVATTGEAATLTLEVDSDVAAGEYPFTVVGQADGLEAGAAAMELTVEPVDAVGQWALVDVAGLHSCGFTHAGEAYCWGQNNAGQLGHGSAAAMEARPVPVAGGSRWTTLSAGSTAGQGFTCGVTIAGEAYCWGNNWLRQLGTGSLAGEREHTPAPVAAPEGVTWTRVSAGIDSYACALAADGDGYCWGQEHGGRLGVGSGSVHAAPTLVAGGHTWLDISAGSVHSCGITTDGDAYCWGGNSSGQLGNGAFSAGEQRTPAPVVGEHKWTAIVTGDRHTCGITVEGDAYCWGANGQGTAGIGQTSARLLTPAPVAGGLKWRSLTAGTANTCGVTVAGAAYCWGANQYGQVGQGTTSTSEPSPTPVAGGHAWAVLSAGQWHVCGATLAGAAYCWGRNTFGTLGIGGDATAVYPIPTEVVASH